MASVEVLWETFGTDVAPSVGDLVKNVSYAVDGEGKTYISFDATYKKGNALIAAKDADGEILWSWHIWLTDKPEEQVYYNNAGTMMDRNLGATSATPGEVSALGLLYQWGRKDPFLGSSSISSATQAKSTGTWLNKTTTKIYGTVAYAQAHPTTFICADKSGSNDWHFAERDNTLWQSTKTIYDPCPPGWRVPNGGTNGVWAKAVGSSNQITDYPFDTDDKGMDFSNKFGNSFIIWYPAAGSLSYNSGQLVDVANKGVCLSVWTKTNDKYADGIYFTSGGNIRPSYACNRASGYSVRCCKEE